MRRQAHPLPPAQLWEEYFEEGMSKPEAEDVLAGLLATSIELRRIGFRHAPGRADFCKKTRTFTGRERELAKALGAIGGVSTKP